MLSYSVGAKKYIYISHRDFRVLKVKTRSLDKFLLKAQLHFIAYHFSFCCNIICCHKLCVPDKSYSDSMKGNIYNITLPK